MGRLVTAMSDLHLEFGIDAELELPGGDILLLAGDIFTSAGARKGHLYHVYKKFCEKQLRKYETILYICGNHEHYHDIREESHGAIQAFLAEHAPNVQMLENNCVEIDGVAFIGCTMWTPAGTDCGRSQIIQQSMNDFELICTRDACGRIARFKPIDAAMLHNRSIAYLQKQLAIRAAKTKRKRAMPCVIMTHHAPSFRCSNADRCKDDYGYGGASEGWCVDVEYLMRGNPHLARWVYGHTHRNMEFTIGRTIVSSNCHGYPGRESANFNPEAIKFDLDDIKIAVKENIKEEKNAAKFEMLREKEETR